jgi:hypothetical protein
MYFLGMCENLEQNNSHPRLWTDSQCSDIQIALTIAMRLHVRSSRGRPETLDMQPFPRRSERGSTNWARQRLALSKQRGCRIPACVSSAEDLVVIVVETRSSLMVFRGWSTSPSLSASTHHPISRSISNHRRHPWKGYLFTLHNIADELDPSTCSDK